MAGTAIRVCARFRPVNKIEKSENARIVVFIMNKNQVNIKQVRQKPRMFFLDHIFAPNADQEEVYKFAGMPLIDDILNGYNATMFAYGQTGSGKTHTMQGDMSSDRFMGLIPRMVNAIFDGIMDASDELDFTVQVSYVEIYLEKIRDLLDIRNSNLKIRSSKSKGIYIEGVESRYVRSSDEIMSFMEEGQQSRACAATRMNASSSRSHAVFIFRLLSKNRTTESKKLSKLMMVDLAGSEKTRKTQSSGQLLNEAKQINKSLSTLGKVISTLTSGKRHVPYRDSKLTRLLSDSLGGNSKTCIIVTCSPCNYNIDETISTLRFGINCKQVKNKPIVNKEMSIAEYKALLEKKKWNEERLMRKIEVLQNALEAAGIEVKDILRNEQLMRSKGNRIPAKNCELQTSQSVPAMVTSSSRSDAVLDMLKERVDELEVLFNRECEEKEKYMDYYVDGRDELEKVENRIKVIEREKVILDSDVRQLNIRLKLKETEIELLNKGKQEKTKRISELILQLKAIEEKHQEEMSNRIEKVDHRGNKEIEKLLKENEYLKQSIKNKEEEITRIKISSDETTEREKQIWQMKLAQMERAVALADHVYTEYRERAQNEIEEKEFELQTLKTFIYNEQTRKRKSKSGRRYNINVPVNRSVESKKRLSSSKKSSNQRKKLLRRRSIALSRGASIDDQISGTGI